jgi:uncharacterized Ntn-hydrolase superfamily protein
MRKQLAFGAHPLREEAKKKSDEVTRKNSKTGTFSILAISPNSRLMGVAVASGSTSVGDRVPHAKPGVGVIATQAYTNVAYGINGLELLTKGLSPKQTLDRLLMKDVGRELRQVAIMDFNRRKAVFTGVKAPQFRVEIVGDSYVVVGNLLAGKEVVKSMAEEFERSSGDLAWRMARALKAGSKSGGDRRGEKSAALIVVSTEKPEVDIKVDKHVNPIGELFRRLSQ